MGDPPELPLGAPNPQKWITPKHPTNMLVDWAYLDFSTPERSFTHYLILWWPLC